MDLSQLLKRSDLDPFEELLSLAVWPKGRPAARLTGRTYGRP